MLIKTDHSIPNQPDSWKCTLSWGDIAMFRFPLSLGRTRQLSKALPCLILDIDDFAEDRFATLAYGIDADTTPPSTYETLVSRPVALVRAGLETPTRFVGQHRLTVSLHNKGFMLAADGSPVIGKLTGIERARFSKLRARIRAEVDIAANYRSERRRKQA
ncbi:hypothetical protein [Cohaesibacter intestini]|uniref:hypothetical protein n=1 Tax=Cohaesibacter intestini TaxID=2211145 RepID=UPI000DE8C279|nr:hypothetical protein [Cohaesibacter intestini]